LVHPNGKPEKLTFEVSTQNDGEPSDLPLVWRQTNLVAEFGDEPIFLGSAGSTPQFTALLEATSKARNDALESLAAGPTADLEVPGETDPITFEGLERAAAVARISIPPGGGKGRLLSFFTTRQELMPGHTKEFPFQCLFANRLPGQDAGRTDAMREIAGIASRRQYVACFAVHLTFVLEFSSCMIAFARILQNVLPDLRKELADLGDERAKEKKWDVFLEHPFHSNKQVDPCIKTLQEMFSFLKDMCPPKGWNTRVIAIFSYLDRLVDEKGDA